MTTSHPSPEWQSDNSLLACLQHLFDTRIGADVRFLVGERQDITMGHRSILICRSPVFCDILATQNPDPVLCEWSLKVTNTTTNIFDIFLRYLYTDYVSEEITEPIAKALIRLAQRYRVNTLIKYLKGILNNVQKTVPNSVETSDSVSPESNVTGRQSTALGRVWHSTCDNSMYLVNTAYRNHTQTSEGGVPEGQTQQGKSLNRNQSQDNITDRTHRDHRSTVLVTDTENNRTMHFKVDDTEDSDTSENTSGNLTSDSRVRNPRDRKSRSRTSDKDSVDDTSQNMLNKNSIPFIKTEVEDDLFDKSISSQGIGVPIETNEDASFQLPPRTVSQTETLISDIKEELPTEESMDTETPSEHDYTVSYSEDSANVQTGETTAAGYKKKGRLRCGDNIVSGRDLYPAGQTSPHTDEMDISLTRPVDGSLRDFSRDTEVESSQSQAQKTVTSCKPKATHTKQKQPLDVSESMTCDICSKVYERIDSLTRHMKSHDPNLVPCSTCHMYFTSQLLLDNHNRITHSEKYLCTMCGNVFGRKYSLMCHMRCHIPQEEARYKCPIEKCGKVYHSNTKYSDHINRHTGAKPHTCTKCEKAFSSVSSCRNHKQHCILGKVEKCKDCGKEFSSTGSLNNHVKAVHQNTEYRCECGKVYKYPNGLLNHRFRKGHYTR